MRQPAPAAESYPLAEGVVALPGGFALLLAARALVCADAHLGYEDVMGGGAALPLWSTGEITAAIAAAARRHAVREIVFLGDAIHGAALSEGAARAIRAALESLRRLAAVTIVAGNHEGRSRGVAVLGETVESCERGGWTLLHGDKPEPSRPRTMIGHLHPSLRVGAGITVPAFLAAPSLIVVPALTPYSSGLDVLGRACREALAPWGVGRSALQVVAATADRVFPFGSLAALAGTRGAWSATFAGHHRRLRPG
jgi:metallophosphoesterase superfamily enzyme